MQPEMVSFYDFVDRIGSLKMDLLPLYSSNGASALLLLCVFPQSPMAPAKRSPATGTKTLNEKSAMMCKMAGSSNGKTIREV